MNSIHSAITKTLFYSCMTFLLLVVSPLSHADVAAPTPQIQAAVAPVVTINTGDNAWLLASAALVLMMTAPGLILFYGGLVRTKNVLSTMMHSLVLMALISALWMVFGYSMAFGEGSAFFGNPFTHLFCRASAPARRTRIMPPPFRPRRSCCFR